MTNQDATTSLGPAKSAASLPAALPVDRSAELALSADAVHSQVQLIQEVMSRVMKDEEHFGQIPGTSREGEKKKKVLYKAGAEKLAMTFRLAPRYEITRIDLERGHREYEIVCHLYSIATGNFLGSGVGSATTMEGKYRFRYARRVCPECGAEAIIKGKEQFGGGWICYKNLGGCGAKFKGTDQQITGQQVGKVEHENPADYYNTVLKMGKKRAFVDATLTVTAASDIFAQDLEDIDDPDDPRLDQDKPPSRSGKKQGSGGGQGHAFQDKRKATEKWVQYFRDTLSHYGVSEEAELEYLKKARVTAVEDLTLGQIRRLTADIEADYKQAARQNDKGQNEPEPDPGPASEDREPPPGDDPTQDALTRDSVLALGREHGVSEADIVAALEIESFTRPTFRQLEQAREFIKAMAAQQEEAPPSQDDGLFEDGAEA